MTKTQTVPRGTADWSNEIRQTNFEFKNMEIIGSSEKKNMLFDPTILNQWEN